MVKIKKKVGIFWNRKDILYILLANIWIFMIAPFNWVYYDVRYFIEWCNVAVSHGLLSVYAYADKVAYPPLAVIFFVPIYLLATTITNNIILIRIIVKLPLIIVFNLIYYVLLKFYGLKTAKYWLISYGSYLTIFAYQFDLYTALFLLLSLICLTRYRNGLLTGLFMSLAILVKPLVIFVGFIPLIKFYSERRIKELVRYIVSGVITALIVAMPFMLYSPSAFLTKTIIFHSDRLPQELSVWAIPLYIFKFNYILLPSFIIWLWFPLMLIGVAVYLFIFYRSKNYDEISIVKAYAAILIVCLITNKIGGLNYYTWIIPFLAILLANGPLNIKSVKIIYITLPIITMLLYPFTTLTAAAIVHGQVFIAEDKRFYSAVWLVEESFIGSESFIHQLFFICRAYLYSFISLLYYYRWATKLLYVLIYNSMLSVILYRIYGARRIKLLVPHHKKPSKILLTSSTTP